MLFERLKPVKPSAYVQAFSSLWMKETPPESLAEDSDTVLVYARKALWGEQRRDTTHGKSSHITSRMCGFHLGKKPRNKAEQLRVLLEKIFWDAQLHRKKSVFVAH